VSAPVRIGALVPLSPPGWVRAGEHLLAGLELAARDFELELVVRDTAADPARAAEAVGDFNRLGAVAAAGEFHSVAARAAAARADELGLPFLCSSAVLDELTDEPTDWVARLAPVQSRGWRLYADFLLDAGHTRVAVAAEPSVYWASGTRILSEHLASRGATVTALDMRAVAPGDVCDLLVDDGATALLLLVGHPEPAVSLVRAVRADPRLGDLLVGAPAGQPELGDWATLLGDEGAGVPFLRYLPERLTALGARVEAELRARVSCPPSFVAYEGYDAIAVLAAMLRSPGTWPDVSVEGTRGEIRFSRPPGSTIWQWAWPPIQVADRDPGAPGRFRVLHAA
jgi:ABC-type branched-subunit amino acid transport system substrate-binding protein